MVADYGLALDARGIMLNLILLCLFLYAVNWAMVGLWDLADKFGWDFLEPPLALLLILSVIASAAASFITAGYGAFLLLRAIISYV